MQIQQLVARQNESLKIPPALKRAVAEVYKWSYRHTNPLFTIIYFITPWEILLGNLAAVIIKTWYT